MNELLKNKILKGLHARTVVSFPDKEGKGWTVTKLSNGRYNVLSNSGRKGERNIDMDRVFDYITKNIEVINADFSDYFCPVYHSNRS